MDEKGWRVVSSYLEMYQHQKKVVNINKLPGSLDDPRSRVFDPKLHKSLNSELKYLYTAVTRAKCNLWIYDSDRKARLPMFDYWHKRNLVKVVQAQPSAGSQGVYTLVFASNSTPEQWKAQGDNFKKKHLWEQAILCYQRAGPENVYLAKEAHAYHLIQRARHQKPQLFLEAALSFLECDDLHHNLHYLNGAALCLKNSKPPKYQDAAKLFERLGEPEKAAQSYLKGRDIENFARLKESAGHHDEVIRALMGKPFMRKRDALAKASEYEAQGIRLHQDLSSSELSYSCAKFYSERRDKDTLIEVLKHMPEVSRKVKFLKEAKIYDEAFKSLIENKEYKDAYRLASAQGTSRQSVYDSSDESWLHRGLKVAEHNKDESVRASFVFQMAKVEYKRLQGGDQGKASSDVVKHLNALLRHKDQHIKAQAYLLLGMLKKDVALCRTAWRSYNSLKNKVAELEAFNQVQQLASESDQTLLDMCHISKEVGKTLMKANDIAKVVKESLSFYGLQKIGNYYYMPQGQDVWIGEPLMKCRCKTGEYDLDGMIKLEASDARDELSKHCLSFKNMWLSHFNLKSKLEPKFMSFPLQKQLWVNRCLTREYSMKEVSAEALRGYLQTSVHLLELRSLQDNSTDGLIALLVSVFSPRVYIYLPQRFKEEHVAIVRRSVNSRGLFRHFIKATVQANGSSEKAPERVKADTWLVAWRASCISEPDLKYLIDMLLSLEKKVNDESKKPVEPGGRYEPPPGFIHWRKDQKFYHIFSFWLQSCEEMREKKRFLWSSKLAIFHFLGAIAEHSNECSISVINAVDILSVYCTGLLAIITHANAIQGRPTFCTVPLFYRSSTSLFGLMNSVKKEERLLQTACAEEVKSWRNLGKLYNECRILLTRALLLLLGGNPRSPYYSILKTGLKKIPSTDATKQCLILALVLFGNLSALRVRETREFHKKIQALLKRALGREENIPMYILTAYKAALNPHFPNPAEVFKLVEVLLHDAKVDSTLARLTFKAKGQHSRVEIVPMRAHQQPMPVNPASIPPGVVRSTLHTHSSAPGPVGTAPGPMQTAPGPISPAVGPFSGSMPGHQLTAESVRYPTIGPDSTGIPFTTGVSGLSVPHTALPELGSSAQQPTGFSSLPTDDSSVDVPFTMGQVPTVNQPIGFERRSVEGSVAQEPIKAHVVDSCTADELQKLYNMAKKTDENVTGQQEFAPFTFGIPGAEFVEHEEAQLEPEADSDAREQEEDMSMTLKGDEMSQLLSRIDPELIHPDIVTQTFCEACGVSLKSSQHDQAGEGDEEAMELGDLELYSTHVCSEAHSASVLLLKKFTAISLNESGKELYPTLREELSSFLLDCQSLKNQYDSSKMDRAIDSIQEELEKNDKRISELEETRSWRIAIDEISKMVDSMDRLLRRYKSIYSQECEELKRSKRWRYGPEGSLEGDGGDVDTQEKKEQQEFDKLSERYDPSDAPVTNLKGGGASGSKKLRSEEDKLKARTKKRDKRRPGK